MRRGPWMNDKTAHIANIGNMAVQLQAVDEPLTSVTTTLDHKAWD